jgi:hypothetical protein
MAFIYDFLPVKQSCTGDATAELGSDVHCRPERRYEPGEEAGNRYGRIYVSACKTIGNVNELRIAL